MNTRKKGKIGKIIATVAMLLYGIVAIYPFIFMVSSGFKPSGEVLATPLQLITPNASFMNYREIFSHEYFNFSCWYVNTFVMAGLTLILKYFVVTITAYGFSKIRFPGRDGIFLILLGALMIPSDIMIMPRYIIFKQLGILNTMWSLILPSTVDVYFVFLIRQAFVSVSDSISEAARIDGCGHFKIYRKIIMPLAKPAVATMLLFSFVWVWNDYMGPYLYISDLNKQMLSVGIRLFASGQVQDYGAQMAGATVVLVPIIILFFICQRYFVEGVTSGAVKG